MPRPTVNKYINTFEAHGDYFMPEEGAVTRGMSVPPIAFNALWILLREAPTLYFDEIKARLALPPVNVTISTSTLYRMLRTMGVSRQKVSA